MKDQQVQILQDRSGLADFPFKSQLRHYMSKHNDRIPQLDELNGANSEGYLRDELSLPKGKSNTWKSLQEITKANSFQEAIQMLNNTYRDLEIVGNYFKSKKGDRYSLIIKHRPQVVDTIDSAPLNYTIDNLATKYALDSLTDKLAQLYGINIHEVTTEELADVQNHPEYAEMNALGAQTAKGFIYHGDIYINTSNYTKDTKIHEMLHLIFGSIKFQHRELYNNLIQMAPELNEQRYAVFAEQNKNLTPNDLAEEYMVTEIARYLSNSGLDLDKRTNKIYETNPDEVSILYKVDPDIRYQVMYNMNRILDTIFMGNYSVKSFQSNEQLYNYSIEDLTKLVNSALLRNNYQGSLDDAQISRISANLKTMYKKSGALEIKC